MEIHYRTFRPTDGPVVAELIQGLYREDPSSRGMTPQKIRHTFDFITAHPEQGAIIVLEYDAEIIGYSILINFWSNEYGGNILYIDELYVKQAYRSRGIGTNFIRYLAKTMFENSVALQLEVTPDNTQARKLYESLGFIRHKNDRLTLELV